MAIFEPPELGRGLRGLTPAFEREAGGEAEFDPYFDNVSLLLPFDGANDSTTFTDESNNAFAITRTGTVVISTNQGKYGRASAFFPSGGQYLRAPIDPALQFAGDFTIEADIYPTTTGDEILFSSASDTNTQVLRINEAATGRISAYLNGNQAIGTRAAGITANTWQHIALTRSESTVRVFVEGDQIGADSTYSGTFRLDVIGTFFFSNTLFGTNHYSGYMQNLRVTKGVARYMANFTPPTEPFPTFGP